MGSVLLCGSVSRNHNVKQFSGAAPGQDFYFQPCASVLAADGSTCWHLGIPGPLGSSSEWPLEFFFPSWPFAQHSQSRSACPEVFFCQTISTGPAQAAAIHASHWALLRRAAGQQLRKNSNPFFLFSKTHQKVKCFHQPR